MVKNMSTNKFVCQIHSDQSCVVDSRNPHAVYFDEPGVTQQSFKDECDINNILLRASLGNAVTHVNSRVPLYGDVSQIPDYRTALDQVRRAEGLFMELNAQVRKRFDNDPAKFLDFVNDSKNRDEAASLGLLRPEVIEAIKASKVALPVKGDSDAPQAKPKGEQK